MGARGLVCIAERSDHTRFNRVLEDAGHRRASPTRRDSWSPDPESTLGRVPATGVPHMPASCSARMWAIVEREWLTMTYLGHRRAEKTSTITRFTRLAGIWGEWRAAASAISSLIFPESPAS